MTITMTTYNIMNRNIVIGGDGHAFEKGGNAGEYISSYFKTLL